MKRKSTEGKTGEHMLLPQGELHLQMQKLIYDYLISQGLTATARSLTKEISSDSKYFKSIYCPDNLPLVYKTYLNVKEISRTCINDTSGPPFEPVSDQQEQESSEANKEKSDKQPRRKRKKSDADGGGDDRADVSSSQNVAMVSSSSSPANTRYIVRLRWWICIFIFYYCTDFPLHRTLFLRFLEIMKKTPPQ